MPLHPNDVERCPSRGRLVTHRAHGDLCAICDPEVEWTARCPSCRIGAPARGGVVLPHEVPSVWLTDRARVCPGSGAKVQPPAVHERPFRRAA